MVNINFRIYENEAEEAKNGIELRRRSMARDPAFAARRATFSVLQSTPEPKLFGFIYDHELGNAGSLTFLAQSLRMRVFASSVMPYYGPMQLVGQDA